MPNWCENSLRIQGNKESLEKFLLACRWKGAKGRSQSFSFLPFSPKERQEEWSYDWCVANWGTKWDADTHAICVSKDWTTMYIRFDTAWSPPIPMLDVWEERFPDLTFTLRYYEGGMWFMGENDNDVDLPEIPDDNEEQEEAHDEYVAGFMGFTDDDVNPDEIIRIPLIEGESYNA